MKLLGFEWKKIISGKLLLIALLIFILNLGTYYIYMIPWMSAGQEEENYQNWEKEQEIKAISDYGVFIREMKKRAEEMSGISIFNKEGSFSQKNIEKTIKDFEGLEELVLKPQSENGMYLLHHFYLTDIFMVLFVCLVCFQEYGKDSKSGMGNLIQVTPKGKGRLRLAQMQAIALSIVLAGILFYGTNLLLTGWAVGFGDISGYVQAMPMFRNVSFPCTVKTYLILFMLWKAAALLFISIVLQFFAVMFGGNKISWIFSGGLLAVSFGLWFFMPDSPEAKFFQYLNLIGILDARQILGNYQNLNIFGHPVNLLHAAIFFIAVAGCLLIFFIVVVKRREFGGMKLELSVRKKEEYGKIHLHMNIIKFL